MGIPFLGTYPKAAKLTKYRIIVLASSTWLSLYVPCGEMGDVGTMSRVGKRVGDEEAQELGEGGGGSRGMPRR